MEPDVARLAHVGERFDRVDSACEGRPGRRDHRDGRDPGGAIGVDGDGDGLRDQPAILVLRQRAHPVGAEPEQLGGADHRVVRLP